MKPAAIRVVTGNFAESPVAQVLHLIQEDKETATLVCRNGDKKRALFFSRGLAADAESNVPGETFIDLLQSMGKLTPEQHQFVTEHEGGNKSHAQLAVEQGILPVRDVVGFVRIHILEVAMALFQESAGLFKLILGEMPNRGFSAKIPIPELLFSGAKKIPLEILAKHLGSLDRKAQVVTGKAIDASWQLSDAELRLLQSVKQHKPSYKSIIEQGDRTAMAALLYTLEVLGYLSPQDGRKTADSISEFRKARSDERKKTDKKEAREAAEHPSLPKPDDRQAAGHLPKPGEKQASSGELPKPEKPAAALPAGDGSVDLGRYDKLEEMTYYEILQVGVSATETELKASYFRLAKQYHPDRFFGGAAATLERARRIFEMQSRSYNALKDPLQRREYDQALLDKKAGKVRPEDQKETEEMQRARVNFQQAMAALEIKDYNSAVEALRRTVENNPDDARAWGILAEVQSRFPRWRVESAEALERALQLKPESPDFLHLKASLLLKQGELVEALSFAQKAAKFGKSSDPKHEALLKEIEAKVQEAKSKGGFLGKFFG